MGDIIHGMPAIAALRRAKPELKIGWLIEERWAELLCSRKTERLAPTLATQAPGRLGPRGKLLPLAARTVSAETWHEIRSCLREVRAMKYELALDLQGSIRSALAARATGASVRVGSSQPREAPATMFYTRAIEPAGAHVVEQALSMASAVAGEQLEYSRAAFPARSGARSVGRRTSSQSLTASRSPL